MSLPKWLLELQSEVDKLPFGDFDMHIKRHKSSVSEVVVKSKQRMTYTDNGQALDDLARLLTNLIDDGYSGHLAFDMNLKDGIIIRIGIKNAKRL